MELKARDDEKLAFKKALDAHRSGKLANAISIYRRLLANAGDPNVQGLLGAALMQDGRLDDGLRHLHAAFGAAPENMTILCNYGHALCLARRFEEAEGIYARAAACDPSSNEVFSRLVALCDENGRFDAMLKAARRRLERDPNDVEAHVALAKGFLTSGDLERGWPEFEWRWRADGYVQERERLFNRPLWDGRPLGQRTLMVHAEMGVGDTIQMIRFVPWLTRSYPEACFILFVDPNLRELLANTFADYKSVRVERTEANRIEVDYDFHLPLMSLARVYGARLDDLESRCPYILVNGARSYGNGQDPTVGLAWYTKAKEDGPRRSIPLEDFLPFSRIDGVRLIDLQYGDTEGERRAFAGKGGVIHHDDSVDQLASIRAFAEQIMGCDLIVTIDNSTAHVAGALGKPTWLLLHRTANWRWLKDREDSPWYPSLRLYRQGKTGTWAPVIEQVTADLRALAVSHDRP